VFNQFNYWWYSKGSPFGMLPTYSLSPPYPQEFNFRFTIFPLLRSTIVERHQTHSFYYHSGPVSLQSYSLQFDLAPSCLLSDCLNMTCFALTCTAQGGKGCVSNSSISIGNCAANQWYHNSWVPLYFDSATLIPNCKLQQSSNGPRSVVHDE